MPRPRPAGIFGLALALATCAPAAPPHTMPHDDTTRLADCFTQIARSVGPLTTPMELPEHACFREFMAAPGQPTRALQQIFESPEYSEDVKIIAGYALKKLGPEDFARVGEGLLDLLGAHQLSPEFVKRALLPGLQWNYTLAEHHDHPAIHKLLTRLLATPELPSKTHDYIRRKILTGIAKQDVAELRDRGELAEFAPTP